MRISSTANITVLAVLVLATILGSAVPAYTYSSSSVLSVSHLRSGSHSSARRSGDRFVSKRLLQSSENEKENENEEVSENEEDLTEYKVHDPSINPEVKWLGSLIGVALLFTACFGVDFCCILRRGRLENNWTTADEPTVTRVGQVGD